MRTGPLFLSGILALAACTSATGELRGGETRFDASERKPFDAGYYECFEDAREQRDGTETTWTALYRDLFGPTAISSCAGFGACHGTLGQAGSRTSQFVCGDPKECRESLFSSNLVRPDPGGGPADPQNLLAILRSPKSPGGYMPKEPACTFTARSIERIEAWAQNGAPDD